MQAKFQAKNKKIAPEADLLIGRSKIESVKTIKNASYLLCWTYVVERPLQLPRCRKLSQLVGAGHCFKYIPRKIKILICNVLFWNHSNHCCLVWGAASKSNIHCLSCRKILIRLLISHKPYDAPTQPLFTTFHLLTFRNLSTVWHWRIAMSSSTR